MTNYQVDEKNEYKITKKIFKNLRKIFEFYGTQHDAS